MKLSSTTRRRIADKLNRLYGPKGTEALDSLEQILADHPDVPRRSTSPWSERDVVLITYGDQVRSDEESPLAALREFLHINRMDEVINTVHILPFFPYSSDDGFSVIDYRQVDPQLGDWDDVLRLAESFRLAFDLVINHVSQQSRWFQEFLASREPYRDYFITMDPSEDLSQVTRPRSTPLLTAFETVDGTRHVWTTFSDDQIDLNFANPAVLLEMLDVLLGYIDYGAYVIRLDAIAYLWKSPGTSCIHLPETHLIVKLMRDLVEDCAPSTILLTETNVPHVENVSYFGDGDEAHMVYQFSLAPLLLDAFLTGDATPLQTWLVELEPAQPGTTYFNFSASHDGVGVRPLEGLVEPERLEQMVDAVLERGGRVSTRRKPDGTDSPYELNITYFSALGPPGVEDDDQHATRFLSSQAVMLALRGIPGIYFHSLFGTPNDRDGMQRTGRHRTINRRKFHVDELAPIVEGDGGVQSAVFRRYREMLAVRVVQPAFHPDAPQNFVDTEDPALVAFRRQSLDDSQTILVLVNVSESEVEVDLSALDPQAFDCDLLSGESIDTRTFPLAPFSTVWLSRSVR